MPGTKKSPLALPPNNTSAYPEALTQVTTESIRAVMLHYARGDSTQARHHIIASGLELMLKAGTIKDIGLRSVIERAGYGFSRFYKLWPSLETFHYDVWCFGLECHSLSEREHLRQVGSESLEAFADTLTRHMVLAQHLISPVLFKHLMTEYANGDMLQMLSHTPDHVRATHSVFTLLFPQDAQRLSLEDAMAFGWMVGTYLFSRLLSDSRHEDDESTVQSLSSQLLKLKP